MIRQHWILASALCIGGLLVGCDDGDGDPLGSDAAARRTDGGGGQGGGGAGGGQGGGAGGGQGGGAGGGQGGDGGGQGGVGGGQGGAGGGQGGAGGGQGGAGGGQGGAGGGGPIDCGAPAPGPDADTCEVIAGGDAVLISGQLLTPGGPMTGGQVLISAGGIIQCVACDCSAHPDAADATRINCGDNVVSPGLINAHDHISFTQNRPGRWGNERFEHRHDWRRGQNGHTRVRATGRASSQEMAWGELRQVLVGTTSLAGSGSTNGFLRNLDRRNASGGLPAPELELDTFPLGDTGGERRESGCNYPDLPSANVVGGPSAYSPHVAEGIGVDARNEFLCLSSAPGGVDVTEPGAAFIHGIGLLPIDGAELAANQTAVVWSPRSNISLYGHTAPVTMLRTQGVLLALGTDWTPSGSVNMARELRCADQLNTDHYGGFFTDADLWRMATSNAAEALGVDVAIGSLRVGLTGDIAIYAASADGPYRAVIDATPDSTLAVLRSGTPLYGDADLINEMPGTNCDALDVCGTAKQVCTQSEIGSNFGALRNANNGSYELFFCGLPVDEPSCLPFREGEFSGLVSEDDLDGDGRPNATDNCPEVFNAVRPLDGNRQGDADNDGLGDVCDPCPLDANTEQCAVPNADDRDDDGTLNADDNCPNIANADQLDTDEDGKGDLCDACPEDANPGVQGCPVSIYAIKQGEAAVGATVSTEGVVTGVEGKRFFMQLAGAALTDGPAFSGVYVYMSDDQPLEAPQPGDQVRVSGTIQDFFGQTQVSSVTAIEVIAQGVELPEPVEAAPLQLATGGELAAAYEGLLVVTEGGVTAVNPPAGPGDRDPTNAFVLEDQLRINDYLFQPEALPLVNDAVRVTGVLRFANGDSKIEPRSAEDIVSVRVAPPQLVEPSTSRSFAIEGVRLAPMNPRVILRLDRPATEDMLITVVSSAPNRLGVANEFFAIPGSQEVELLAQGIVAGADPVRLTASVNGSEVSIDVIVYGDDQIAQPTTITPDPIVVSTGREIAVTIALDVPAGADAAPIELSVQPAGIASVPASVIPEEGAVSVTVQLAGVGAGQATLTATGSDSEASATVDVSERPALGLVISEVLYDVPGDDNGFEWVELYNGTNAPIDLAGYALGMAGQSYSNATYQLAGQIPAGGCWVVGGPQSVDANANPQLDQPLDFNPDFQNSGNTADAVALFDVTADQIGGATVPIDAVVYGGNNSNSLMDETGGAGEVDVEDVQSGQSIERTAEGWRPQAEPTPNDCNSLF